MGSMKDVDGWDKPGYDERRTIVRYLKGSAHFRSSPNPRVYAMLALFWIR